MTDVTIPTDNSSSRRPWLSLAFWLLLVVWALLFGTLGYAIRDPAALGQILGVRANDLVGLLLLAIAVVGLLAYGAGRSR